LIGQAFKFKVIKFNKKRGNIVLSRRVLLEKERAALKESTLERLKEGQIVEGIVKNITEYGAFIDLGGIDGLLHITDMSWGRVNHPSELFQVGDEVPSRSSSSTPTPSASASASSRSPRIRGATAEKYPGHRRPRQGGLLTDYGAFVELEEGIEGLVHISEMSWTKPGQAPVEDGRSSATRSRRSCSTSTSSRTASRSA
jgi:small subunit ribosomal protein S1